MTVGSGSPLTLFTATYDQTTCGSLQAAPGALLLHDLSYGLAQTARGNPTQVTKLGSTTCTAYQISGIAYQMKDGNNNTMSITTSSSTAYSLPSVLTPNGNTSFNVNVGYSTSFAVTSVTGPNGTNTNTTYDSYGRPSSSVSVDGATTHYCYTYNANASTQTAVISTSNSCTLPLSGQWKQTTLDGFGRTLKVITGHDGVSMAETDTQYGACACSPLGKMVAQSLPYAYGGSPVWTTCTYDGSGRTLTTVQGDGSTTTNAYSSNSTTTTDPANKWKTFTSDAFGNLVTVTEPDPSGVNVTTNYTYNGANQLTQVSMPRTVGGNQITQTRTFAWTGSDLTSSTNPENGTVTYQYDGTHHVTQRMDAKGQKTTYTYDSYERLTQVQHYLANSNGAADAPEQVNYYYDSNPYYGSYSTNATGRLAAVTFQNESTSGAMPSQVHGGSESFIYSYGYNVAGRVTAQQLTVVPMSGYPAALSATYSWDNQGRMTALNYPRAGPQETLSYDAMSNLTGIGGNMCSEEDNYGNCTSWSPMQLVSGASYTNIGQLSGFSVSVAGLSLGNYAYSYNSLQQLSQMGYSSPSSNTNVNFIYTYAVGHNNGRISQFSDSSTGEVVNYTYDSLNRLIAATTSNSSGPVWGESYTYDGFGNLLSKVPTQGTAPQVYVPVTSSTNQVTPADANGNWQGSNSLANAWDVENRLLFSDATDSSGNLVAYSYDPWGKRVLQYANGAGGVTTCVLYFYGVNGKRLGTYNCYYSNGQFVVSTANINVYFGKKLIASGSETSQNAVITDRLGSVRGQGLTANIAYYPYGEERTSTPDNTDKFGTYFRDGYEQDYADQRYYTSNYGRFWSPDPYRATTGSAAEPSNPGSWNRYAYGNGDPANFVDPLGLLADSAESGTFPDFIPVPHPPEPGPPDPVPPAPPSPTPPPPPTVNQQLLAASVKRVAADLTNRPNCAKDFASTVDTVSELGEVGFKDAGPLTFSTNKNGVTRPTSGWLGEYQPFTGSIYLNSNTSINWANPTQSTYILNGQSQAGDLIAYEINFLGLPQGTTMTPDQFMDLIVFHELAHYDGTVGNPDNPKNELKLWNDCVKRP